MSVIYEVNLKVQSKIETDFKSWLSGHIQDVLKIEGFESAKAFKVSSGQTTAGYVELTVHYYLKDRQALENYFEEHAVRLRKPAKDLFGDQFEATRRVLEPVDRF